MKSSFRSFRSFSLVVFVLVFGSQTPVIRAQYIDPTSNLFRYFVAVGPGEVTPLYMDAVGVTSQQYHDYVLVQLRGSIWDGNVGGKHLDSLYLVEDGIVSRSPHLLGMDMPGAGIMPVLKDIGDNVTSLGGENGIPAIRFNENGWYSGPNKYGIPAFMSSGEYFMVMDLGSSYYGPLAVGFMDSKTSAGGQPPFSMITTELARVNTPDGGGGMSAMTLISFVGLLAMKYFKA